MNKLKNTFRLFVSYLIYIIAPPRLIASPGFRILSDAASLSEMRERMTDIRSEVEALQTLIKAQSREFTAAESERIETLSSEYDTLKASVERAQRLSGDGLNAMFDLDDDGRPGQRRAGPQASSNRGGGSPGGRGPGADPAGGSAVEDEQTLFARNNVPDDHWGFRTFGEFAQSVVQASNRTNRVVDSRLQAIVANDELLGPRIRNAASDTAMERIGEEGGFLSPPAWRPEINQQVDAPQNLLDMCDQIPVGGNSLTYPIDETSPWQTSGGVQAYWEGEAHQYQGSRPKLTPGTLRLNKITALVIATEELLEDAPALGAYLGRKAPEKMNFKLSLAIYQGSGVGQPLGFLNAPGTITVAKEAAQAADTVLYANVNKMYGRMYAPYVSGAQWIHNQNVVQALESMTADGAAGGHPVYVPGGTLTGGAAYAPYGMLKGRPMIPHEVAETLGDKGDLMFANFRQYLALVKTDGITERVSEHLYFDYDEVAFKYTRRVGGQPWHPNVITQRDGSGTLSAAVVLAERA